MKVRAHKNCVNDLPAELLIGFIDTTYHNDSLAILVKPLKHNIECLILYCDYFDVEQREDPDRERFTLFKGILENEAGEYQTIDHDNIIIETNDISELFNTINECESK
tara:strand:+ start:134 stop:457 length:324 start_codon:yes stop_codon:yes gene_type:complete